jgi:pimeloyl-ACP methyl ester carboxylesterase
MRFTETIVDGLYVNFIDMTLPHHVEAKTLIFHHGVGANNELWSQWLTVLAPYYKIARFDMRGFGRSAAAVKQNGWSLESLAQDVLQVADSVGAANFHLIGESIGGTIALATALKAPGRVRTLTMSNAAFRGGAVQNVTQWQTLLRHEGTLAWSKEMMAARFHPEALSDEQWQWFEQQQANHPIESIVIVRDILVGADLGPRLQDVRIPVLLMHGDGSPFVPVPQMVELRDKLPNAELHIFGHAKHGLPYSHAIPCAETLLRFLHRNKA